MTLQLREGRTYKARNGDKIGPMRPTTKEDGFCHEWTWTVDGKRAWKTNGSYSDVRPVCGYDLIAEWTEGPVRTVTRREVVAGQHGPLWIEEMRDGFGRPAIYLTTDATYSSTELKAAAAVLLELAGALSDGE